MRVRIAPSPTGNLHIGTARTALFNWLFARKNTGQFLIRVEDTDKERSKPEFTENIFQGLKWLGINWDEAPILQSEKIHSHRKAIQKLLDTGLAYRCFATDSELEAMRLEQAQQGRAPRHDNRHRTLSPEQIQKFKEEGRSSVIRFKIEDSETIRWDDLIRGPMHWKGSDLGGDMVIARRAPSNEIGDPLYNLVVVIDDAEMRITHVIRGEDHIANTAKQLLLYKALGIPQPEFAHTPLILNPEGKKLSKRDGVTSINDFRTMGYLPEALSNYMALLGWSVPDGMEEIFSIEDAANVFDLGKVNKAGAKFDWDKLNWLNSQVIHQYSHKELLGHLLPLWGKYGWAIESEKWGIDLTELIGPSLTLLTDGVNEAKPFFEEPSLEDDGLKQLAQEGAKDSIKVLIQQLISTPWDGINKEAAKEILNETAKKSNCKKGLLMKSLRAALLGKMQGPDLLSSWGLLARVGKDRDRLNRCV